MRRSAKGPERYSHDKRQRSGGVPRNIICGTAMSAIASTTPSAVRRLSIEPCESESLLTQLAREPGSANEETVVHSRHFDRPRYDRRY